MHLETGAPLRGERLGQLKAFLAECGLRYDEGISFTALLLDGGEIAAAGSLDGATLKCIAVSPDHQGEGLTAELMTALRREAFDRGLRHLMLFTKPKNRMMFREFGFTPVIETDDCLLMESRRDGLESFLKSLEKPENTGKTVGCIVANCDPFTLGHRYLVERAAAECDTLHLFILSEEKSTFPAAVRLEAARRGCADLPNVVVHGTGPYMISSATFPDYFLRDASRADEVWCELDLRLFGERIAPALGITVRFVGTEPLSPTTDAYNRAMKTLLPQYGVRVAELPRLEKNGAPVSAGRVRTLLKAGDIAAAAGLVPETTLEQIAKYINTK